MPRRSPTRPWNHWTTAETARLARVGAVVLILAVGLTLTVAVILRVDAERGDFLSEREALARQRLALGLDSFQIARSSAVAEVHAAVTFEFREQKRQDFFSEAFSSSLILQPFLLLGETIVRPQGRTISDDPLVGLSAEIMPQESVGLLRAHKLRAGGELENVLRELRIFQRGEISAPAKAEAGLLASNVLLDTKADPREVEAELLQILSLGDSPAVTPHSFSARLLLGRLLLNEGEHVRGISVILGILSTFVRREVYFSPIGGLDFFRREAQARLARCRSTGILDDELACVLTELELGLQRLDRECRWRDEFESSWVPRLLPALTVRKSGWLQGEGEDLAALLVYSSAPSVEGAAERRKGLMPSDATIGFLVDTDAVRKEVTGFLLPWVAEEEASLELLDPSGVVFFTRGDSIATSVAASTEIVELRVGDALDWTLRIDFGSASRRFMQQQTLLYSTGAGLIWIALALGTVALVRGVSRQVALARLRSRFVANVSHELKTPLTIIRMFSDLLSEGYVRDKEESKRSLTVIRRECETLSTLIDDVLDMSRIEAGERKFRPLVVEPDRVVSDVLIEQRSFLEQKGFDVRFFAEENLPQVSVDPEALAQSVRNLLSNAVKYSGQSREVGIEIAQSLNGVTIDVLDRGIGVAPGEESKIFQRFYRAKDGEGLPAGTGIGLSLVAHFAKAHGGSVTALSREGGGSRFRLWLPIHNENDGFTEGQEDDPRCRG